MLSLVLLLLPFLAAILVLIIRKSIIVKQFSLGISLIQLAITLYLAATVPFSKGLQLEYFISWLPQWGINFHLGIDGISFLLILLTNLLVPFIIYSGYYKTQRSEHLLYSLILLTQFALIGVFSSLNAIVFYIFWELALIPVFFILFLWGGERRQSVTLKFFIYTLFGSLFLLIAFIYLYFQTAAPHNFEYSSILNINLEPCNQYWIFWLLLLSFVIKIPLFPTHSWQPDTYTVAPYQGTMLLGGLLMKMGIYGLIRWVIPVLPDFALQWGYWIALVGLIGMIYFSFIALRQPNLKTMLAFSSLAHGGLMGAAVFSLNQYGLQGVLFQSFQHGILLVLLFYFAQLIEERTDTLNIARLGGIKIVAPRFSALLLVTVLGSIGLPLTNGFVGELLMLLGLLSFKVWAFILGGFTLILGAVYMLYLFQRIALGDTNPVTAEFGDLTNREMVMILPLIMLVLLFGVYPQPLLWLTDGPVRELIELAFNAK
ncbi:MAG: NuoM family protein [Bacteroidales bacterium]